MFYLACQSLIFTRIKKENNTNNESNKNIINDNDYDNNIEKDNEKIDKNFYIKKFNFL